MHTPVARSRLVSAKARAASTPLPLSRAPADAPCRRPRPASTPAVTSEQQTRQRQRPWDRSRQPGQREAGQHHGREPHNPDGDQPSGHALHLGLGIEMGNGPASDRCVATHRDQVGILARLPQREPAESDADAEQDAARGAGQPDREGAPVPHAGENEQRGLEQAGEREARPEQGKAHQSRGMKGESLDGDAVAERLEVLDDEPARRLGCRCSGLARAGQQAADRPPRVGHGKVSRSSLRACRRRQAGPRRRRPPSPSPRRSRPPRSDRPRAARRSGSPAACGRRP